MKRKSIAKPRNSLVALALFRKAGVHRKTNKAIRKAQKQKDKRGYGETVYHSGLLIRQATVRICPVSPVYSIAY